MSKLAPEVPDDINKEKKKADENKSWRKPKRVGEKVWLRGRIGENWFHRGRGIHVPEFDTATDRYLEYLPKKDEISAQPEEEPKIQQLPDSREKSFLPQKKKGFFEKLFGNF